MNKNGKTIKKQNTSSIEYRLGRNIARIREEHHLTQTDMEEYGVSRAYLGRVELGKHSITVSKLQAIANCLNIDIIEFFYDSTGKHI